MEEVLIKKLTPAGSGEYEATQLTQITNLPAGLENGNSYVSPGSENGSGGGGASAGAKREREIAINTQFAWKNMFNRLMGGRDSTELVSWEVDPDVSARVLSAHSSSSFLHSSCPVFLSTREWGERD